MSAFEFFFGFYGLILGLAVAEVVGGLAKALRARGGMRLGLCTPLLALFVLLDLIQFWSDTWTRHQDIQINAAVLTVALAVAAIYYFAASLVFPDRFEDWETVDDYFDRHKRLVIGASLVANLLGLFVLPLVAGQPEVLAGLGSPVAALFLAVWIAPMAAICLVRNRRINAALLALICLVYLVVTFAEAIFAG